MHPIVLVLSQSASCCAWCLLDSDNQTLQEADGGPYELLALAPTPAVAAPGCLPDWPEYCKPRPLLCICRDNGILTGSCISVAGLTAQLCLLQDHDIYHKRLTGEGVPIDEGSKAKMIGPETNLDLMHTENDATNTTVKCGSCYGAQARDEECCNNCEEVGPDAAASPCGCAQPCLSWPGQVSICPGWAFCCALSWE